MPSGQRSNYDLKERVCIGSMTAIENATYQRIPTDEAEAQMLASADLDDMKSETTLTFDSVPSNGDGCSAYMLGVTLSAALGGP